MAKRLERSRSFVYLGFFPVPAYIALIAILHIALPRPLAASLVFDPPVLMLVLNTVFLFGISFAVSATAVRAYLSSGSSNILLLGCGVLALGSAALAGGWVRPLGGEANTSVTIHNLGVLLGAMLHAMSALLTLLRAEPEQSVERRRQKLIWGMAGTLILMAILIAGTLRSWVPLFWAADVGSTPLKQAVLGTAVTLFALTSIYTMVLYIQKRSPFLYWYSIGLALTSIGLIGISVMKAVGDPIGWAGRTAQYLGGVYFLIATFSALREAQAQGMPLEMAIERFFRGSEVHYRDLVDTVIDAIISIDDRKRVLLWNQGAERMLGYTPGEAAGCLVGDLLLPEGNTERLDHGLQGLRKQIINPFGAREFEIEMRRKDGTIFPSETSLSMRRIGSGWTATMVVRDITERKQAEKALWESQQERERHLAQLQAILDHLTDGLVVADLPGNLFHWNPAAVAMHGFESMAECQRRLPEFANTFELSTVDGEILPLEQWPLARILRGETLHGLEIHIRRRETDWRRVFRYGGTLVRDTKGNPLLAVVNITDITVSKQAEQAIRQQALDLQQLTETLETRVQERTAELGKANETLRHLSSKLLSAQEDERKIIARELHDTLGACLSGIKFKVEDVLREIGETANPANESLTTLIPVIQDGVEECRRIQMDLRPPMLDDLGLLPTLSWLCRRFRTIYPGIQVGLEMTLEESGIPPPLKIVIYRVIQEGMNNIAKHSKADLVRLSLRKLDGRVEVVLEDNGQGFDLGKVLGAESTRRGFGLTSMKERIELSGGSFDLQSIAGKGTMIRASWPSNQNN
ncbi:MAG: PAS domain S-box protein [Deltaproteobacteria bacterium]|nr:PAS domain S-box protein [Deltaproteobacteria bacterium]